MDSNYNQCILCCNIAKLDEMGVVCYLTCDIDCQILQHEFITFKSMFKEGGVTGYQYDNGVPIHLDENNNNYIIDYHHTAPLGPRSIPHLLSWIKKNNINITTLISKPLTWKIHGDKCPGKKAKVCDQCYPQYYWDKKNGDKLLESVINYVINILNYDKEKLKNMIEYLEYCEIFDYFDDSEIEFIKIIYKNTTISCKFEECMSIIEECFSHDSSATETGQDAKFLYEKIINTL